MKLNTSTYSVTQVRALRLQPGLQHSYLTGHSLVLCLQALLATVKGRGIPGLLVSIDGLVEVTVEA